MNSTISNKISSTGKKSKFSLLRYNFLAFGLAALICIMVCFQVGQNVAQTLLTNAATVQVVDGSQFPSVPVVSSGSTLPTPVPTTTATAIPVAVLPTSSSTSSVPTATAATVPTATATTAPTAKATTAPTAKAVTKAS